MIVRNDDLRKESPQDLAHAVGRLVVLEHAAHLKLWKQVGRSFDGPRHELRMSSLGMNKTSEHSISKNP